MTEEWRTIPSFPLYQASSLGRVRRDPATQTCRGAKPAALAPSKRPGGYNGYRLRQGDGYRNASGHRLVCEAFHGPAPSPKAEAGTGKLGRADNTPANVFWTSRRENHAKRRGTERHGESIPWVKLNVPKVATIKRRLSEGARVPELAAEFGVSDGAINGIRIGRNWRDIAPEVLT